MDDENLRIFSCDIIQNAGILLKLPQAAITTAHTLLRRVYHTPEYTFDKYPLDVTAMAALFLAAKIEESPRKAREVMDVFTCVVSHKLKRTIVLNYLEHEKLREELITAERRLLKNLGFNLLSSHPHKIIVNYYHAMVRQLDPEENFWTERDNRKLIQRAWNYCNDCLRMTDVFIRHTKEAVACACIQMACRDTKMLFPRSSDGREWYQLFIKNELEVTASIQTIENVYQRDRINPHDLRRYMYLSKK